MKLSILEGGGTDPRDPIVRWVGAAEEAIRNTGAEWTMLRPGRFMSNALAWAPMIRRGNELRVPFATRPAASIDPADIARVATVALTEEGHAGKVYELSGPECLSAAAEIQLLGKRLGRPLRAVALSPEEVRAAMLGHGMPEPVVEAVLAQTHSDRGTTILPTVETVTGRAARTFAQWLEVHLGAFQ